jgi:hypothetical protein
MPEENTLRVGNLVFTRTGAEDRFEFETSGIRIQLELGWIKTKAVVTVQYPKDGPRVEYVGDLPSAIEGALHEVRQDLDLELLRAKRKLAYFNTLSSELLGSLPSIKQPEPQQDSGIPAR